MNHIHSDISYVFKVSFVHGVWRKIQVPSEYSLDIGLPPTKRGNPPLRNKYSKNS